ncbi:MAG: tRNA lysidine(34) synthetase TilS [Elusimicrobiota bacterium]|nr:tRNA lysidine(34) synthetase TilS [Elusimicrobiota bacterium]
MRREEFAAKVWSKLVAFEKEQRFFPPGARVLAAVSGGPDSVALAHWLSVLKRRNGLDAALLHVHHGLRGRAADADAAFVLKLGERLGLPAAVVKVDARSLARKRGLGLEDAGRKARYAALAARARRGRRTIVATGHQLDDQAETLLLHLLRGTRAAGLAGIPPRRALAPGVELVRPLLPLTRDEVMAYLKAHALEWREDASNASEAFERNWVRRRLLPMLEARRPGIKTRLSALAADARARLAERR